ncbi:DUF2937 family protein [Bradyrhizobium sp. 4]|uniref:DUF2937 family protein n=1 Tax=unclassified Bradyrhizobium TaxID=2631580 RepID=UPI001FF98101|nr:MULTISPECIES: DUF2937 family protein [unclassified Bradyrhizobium]MCK1401428.1 DUF2937 family protein [Bradyrhizobium sp. 39]MCK1750202.1 DUF2937 family protein [Bradyrhizobium sp. 135]UPJ36470.1 DUF2937 family protein [Bradyrhizobium sp. 4]
MQRLFAVLSLVGALLFAQIPELLQQYRQRLGGAADELTVIVRNFDEDSRRSGYDRSGALGVMAKNPEQLVRDQAQRMTEYVRRLDRLNEQQSDLANGVTPAAILAVAVDYNKPIMAQAWSAYAPALPTTLTGIVFAIIGWCLPYAAFLVLGAVAGSRTESLRDPTKPRFIGRGTANRAVKLRAAFLYLNSCSRSSPRAAAG